jgi:hypothetical protein
MLLVELSEREQNFSTDILLETYNVKSSTHYLQVGGGQSIKN